MKTVYKDKRYSSLIISLVFSWITKEQEVLYAYLNMDN